MPLIYAKTGESHVIKRVGGSDKVKNHLSNLGFVAGSQISIVNEIAGALIVNIKDSRVAISSEMAKRIVVWKEVVWQH